MTEEFGPLDADSRDVGSLSDRVSGWLLWIVVSAVPDQETSSLSYDMQHNRLSLHGESERAGSAYRVGRIAALTEILTVLVSLVPFLIVGVAHSAAMGTVLEWPLLAVLAAMGSGIIFAFGGISDRATAMTVYDHTTEPTPETDDLAQQYVDGEIESVDELETKAEARLE